MLGTELKDLDFWPDPEERPEYYVDFDETGPVRGRGRRRRVRGELGTATGLQP